MDETKSLEGGASQGDYVIQVHDSPLQIITDCP